MTEREADVLYGDGAEAFADECRRRGVTFLDDFPLVGVHNGSHRINVHVAYLDGPSAGARAAAWACGRVMGGG